MQGHAAARRKHKPKPSGQGLKIVDIACETPWPHSMFVLGNIPSPPPAAQSRWLGRWRVRRDRGAARCFGGRMHNCRRSHHIVSAPSVTLHQGCNNFWSAATAISNPQAVVFVLWRQCAAAHAPGMQARLQPQTWGTTSAQLRLGASNRLLLRCTPGVEGGRYMNSEGWYPFGTNWGQRRLRHDANAYNQSQQEFEWSATLQNALQRRCTSTFVAHATWV